MNDAIMKACTSVCNIFYTDVHALNIKIISTQLFGLTLDENERTLHLASILR